MKKVSILLFAAVLILSPLFYSTKTTVLANERTPIRVTDKIPAVKSEKELQDYFAKVQKVQENPYGKVDTAILESSAESKDSASGGNHSTTNNQVDGVDEADIVQTNDSHVFTISDQNVLILNVKDPKKMTKEATIKLKEDFYPTELLLAKDTLIIIGQRNFTVPMYSDRPADSKKIGMPMQSMVTVYFYDVSNPASPVLTREIATEGHLNGARVTNNTLYYVTNMYPNFWMLRENVDMELRPLTYDSKTDKEVKAMSYDSIHILPNSLEGNYSIISSIDINNLEKNEVATKGYLGGSEQMYMSKDNLYLTSSIYNPMESNENTFMWNPGTMDTKVFKFALSSSGVEYIASTEITGTVLKQFSMDEHNGFFRVVTTEGNSWDESKPSENHLFILNARMKIVGSLTGLAKDERIYSARFMGDKAYMVTFKETDPLFVIDVSKPNAPKVLGELKIPGFSNYLHPLDENHLIGFGYETKSINVDYSKEPLIIRDAMKVSLFDVSDFANPKEKDTAIIGGQGTYSPIQYDHHALFQHKAKNLFGFPVAIYEKTNERDYPQFKQEGALVYEITPEKGITLKGDLLRAKNPNLEYEEWERSIQRMVYMDDSLYTLSMKEITSYDLNTFNKISTLGY
ncbi:beta-propeller domain-containing protein [Psychrobacillus sp.]|uniref:beta-propeller domain-containing protein n=1 Tax=Psychrobacillus sp. TaxID=1871623 RepID=UPI0028BEFD05|nr:beta-propeller domain-containing protein [Psychrobacillus sp.]